MTASAGRHRPLTDQERQEIVQRYVSGETLDQLAIEYPRSRHALKRAIQAAGIVIRPRGYPAGRAWTPAHREAHARGVGTDENRQRARTDLLRRLPDMRGPAVNSPIERRLHDALRSVGVGFTTQSLLLGAYLVDIEIHQAPVIIEADGAQHSLRTIKVRDAERDAKMVVAGYRVFRFTGSAINRDAAACIRTVIDACNLVADRDPVYDIRTSFAGPNHPRWVGLVEFTCAGCGRSFEAPARQRIHKRTFCAMSCYRDVQRGITPNQTKIESGLQRELQRSAEMTGPAACAGGE